MQNTFEPSDKADSSNRSPGAKQPVILVSRIAGLGLIVLGRLFMVFGALLFLSRFVLHNLVVNLISLTLAATCGYSGLRLQMKGKQWRMRAAEEVLLEDLRSPIVYLRPFRADVQTTEYSEEFSVAHLLGASPFSLRTLLTFPVTIPLAYFKLLFAWPLTEEEQLAGALKKLGPAVAVASPGELVPPAGFPRLNLDPARWREQVSALLRRARLVVVRCGVSREAGYWPSRPNELVNDGLAWELRTLVKEVQPQKLALLLPFDQMAYEDFCYKVRETFPYALPPYDEKYFGFTDIRGILIFDKSWKPSIVPLTWIEVVLRFDTRYPLMKGLSEKFRTIAVRGDETRGIRSYPVRRLLATLIDLVFIAAALFLPVQMLAAKYRWLATNRPIALAFEILILMICMFVYSIAFEASGLMATYGKIVLGLVVTDNCGQRIKHSVAVYRIILKILLWPMSWVGMILPRRSTLHDRWANTAVTTGTLRTYRPPWQPFYIVGLTIFLMGCISIAAVTLRTFGLYNPNRVSQLIFPKDSASVNLWFRSAKNQVIFHGSLNGRPVSFLFSSVCGVTLLDRGTAQASEMSIQIGRVAGKSSGSAQEQLEFADSDLKIGTATLVNERFRIVDLTAMRLAIGDHIDGVIGYDLLKQAAVGVDYEGEKLTISNAKTFTYQGTGMVIPLTIRNGWASLAATLKVPGRQPIISEFWVDSGSPSAVNHPSIRQSTGALTKIKLSTGSGGRTVDVLEGKIEYIQLGSLKLSGLSSVCCTGSDEQDRQIGASIWRQFNVTFDFPHYRLILENGPTPQKRPAAIFPEDTRVYRKRERPIVPKETPAPAPQVEVDVVRQAELEQLAQAVDRNSMWTGYPNCKVILNVLEVTPTPASLKSIDKIPCGESLDIIRSEDKFYLVRTKRSILGYVVANAVSRSK
jgi:uncharacterized RDD family membrane protein YckC